MLKAGKDKSRCQESGSTINCSWLTVKGAPQDRANGRTAHARRTFPRFQTLQSTLQDRPPFLSRPGHVWPPTKWQMNIEPTLSTYYLQKRRKLTHHAGCTCRVHFRSLTLVSFCIRTFPHAKKKQILANYFAVQKWHQAKFLHCVRTACAEAGILTQEYLSPV